jgi:hypothetical protein
MKNQKLLLLLLLFAIKISAQENCYNYNSISYPAPDAEITVTHPTGANRYVHLTAWIKYGNGNNNQLRKPFLFIEGIDFNRCNKNHKYGDFGWPDFITGNYEKDLTELGEVFS